VDARSEAGPAHGPAPHFREPVASNRLAAIVDEDQAKFVAVIDREGSLFRLRLHGADRRRPSSRQRRLVRSRLMV
jgi:hypothetical protein